MSGTLERNLAAVGRRFPELAALVASSEPERLEAVTTPSGGPSARIPGGAWLHSSRSPEAEARRLAAAALSGGEDCAVVLGFGLGYPAEACLEAGAERLVVAEAEPGMLKAAFGLRDLAGLLADERLGFVVGGEPEALVSALELSGARRTGLVALEAARRMRPDWYAGARAAAERWIAKSSINEATLRRFGRLWVRNLAGNVGRIASSPGVASLEGRFAGVPALVLAAGPSLDSVLPRVPDLARKALIVCVDTALRSLLRSGLEPDFLVVVDPQYWNWRHVADLASPRSILVSESAAWPAVFRRESRRVFLGGSLFPLGRAIEAMVGPKGRLGAGGSVATSAWDLARLAGCDPVWMAGLDLGYPGGATHARASLFEQRALAEARRLRPGATRQAEALFGADTRLATANDGGRVLTDRRMELYAWWFESRVARCPGTRTRSLCPRGLAIPGIAPGEAEELLAGPDRRAEIEALLAEAAAIEAPAEAAARTEEGIRALSDELRSIAAAAEAGLEAAESALAARAEEAASRDASIATGAGAAPSSSALAGAGTSLAAALAALERADHAILASAAKEVASFLLPPLAELVGRRAATLGENLEQSRAIYRGVAESARYHLEALGRG